jgi:hypothetical protein
MRRREAFRASFRRLRRKGRKRVRLNNYKAMPGENKLKMGRGPVYQPIQPVKLSNSPVKTLISPVNLFFSPVKMSISPVKTLISPVKLFF